MKNVVLIIFFAATAGLGVWAYMNVLDTQNGAEQEQLGSDHPLATEKDCVDKLTQYKMRRDKIKRAIMQVERQQSENINYLTEKGISKVEDAKGDPEATMALNNMKALNDVVAKHQEEVKQLDTAISRLDGMIKKIRRENLEKSVGLNEEQMVQLIAIQKELDDKLGINENDILQDAELDALLQKERQKDKERSEQELLKNGK